MVGFHKHFMFQYTEKDGKIIVSSIIAHGNFQCTYSKHIYDSIDDLKKDLDDGKFGR